MCRSVLYDEFEGLVISKTKLTCIYCNNMNQDDLYEFKMFNEILEIMIMIMLVGQTDVTLILPRPQLNILQHNLLQIKFYS